MPVKILIVDDHEIVREGVRTLIVRSRPEWKIVGEASGGAQAIEMCKTLYPDVLVLDITMPGMSGLEAASAIADLGSGCRVLIFTMHESQRLAGEVRQVGAHGLVLKSQATRDLIRAIDSLLAGNTFFGSDPSREANSSGSGAALDSSPNRSVKECRDLGLSSPRVRASIMIPQNVTGVAAPIPTTADKPPEPVLIASRQLAVLFFPLAKLAIG